MTTTTSPLRALARAGALVSLALAAPLPAQQGEPPSFPHVRVDVAGRTVEIDGVVPIDVGDADVPDVYLELVACTPDTREHESLVVTHAAPSHVHAVLLLIGLEPGEPGRWNLDADEFTFSPPTGDELRARFVFKDADGAERVATISDWAKNILTGEPLPDLNFVFAGSRFVQRGGAERYDADAAGTLIGLTTFSSETIAWPRVHSPDSDVETPAWVARNDNVPAYGTRVTIRLTPVE